VIRRLGEYLNLIALTLWVGGLWTIGFVVAPTLFRSLDSRAQAGAIAGELFSLMAYIGLACGGYLALYRLFRFGAGALRQLSFWIVLGMLLLVAASQFGVAPILAGLKEQALPKQVMESIFRDRFATWHGVSSGLYVIVSVLGAALVVAQGRSPR
jgi:uncharacterized membrane protein